MELVRQPIYLLLLTVSSAFGVFLAVVPYFGFGDDPKLVKDSVLAVMLIAGMFGAVLSASASVAHEIRSGTALAVLSKPVGRARFLLAKYVGLAGALLVLNYANMLSALLASRMAFDAYGDADRLAFGIYVGGVIAAYALGGLTNYFLRRPFVADAVFFVLALMTATFVLINFVGKDGNLQQFAKGVDWRLVKASILILFALWILAGLALACSTRLEMIPTLAICSGFLLIGLMSDYFFGRVWKDTGAWWAGVMYAVTPNWQLFWPADAMDKSQGIPWRYMAEASGYMLGYLAAALSLALCLFEDRELT